MGLFDWFRDAVETDDLIDKANKAVDQQFDSPHVVFDKQTQTESSSEFENWEAARKEADQLNDAAGQRRYVPRPKQ